MKASWNDTTEKIPVILPVFGAHYWKNQRSARITLYKIRMRMIQLLWTNSVVERTRAQSSPRTSLCLYLRHILLCGQFSVWMASESKHQRSR
jgi:hypothetical protein